MPRDGGARRWSAAELREHLEALPDRAFTQLVADLWHRQGWSVEVSDKPTEADIRVTKTTPYPKKGLIQIVPATENSPVGVSAIDELASLKRIEPSTDEAIIVTLLEATDAARSRARAENVTLIDGEDLVALVETISGYDIVDHYVEKGNGGDAGESAASVPSAPDTTYRRSRSIEGRQGPAPSRTRDFGTYQEAPEYTAQQALERAATTVELNPSDAAELGVFDGIQWDVVDAFEEHKQELAFMRDDLHLTRDSVLFVADLTEYAPRAAIVGRPQGRVAGMIRRDVPDDAWLASTGAAALRVQSIVDRIHESVEQAVVRKRSAGENGDVKDPTLRYVIAGGVVGWMGLGGLLLAPASVSGRLFTVLLVTIWIGLPLGIVADAIQTRVLLVRPKATVLLVLVSLIPWLSIVAGALYLYQRETINWTSA
ncbi:restriction endonuclease [Halobacterium bonnevillei]|uniref:Restriction endonuclease type IV Mrr domain-containing protein n=1 Tax=Halobacterium bonnevillei TaxID=2692200 RepID=A0A6B0SEQ3_9EURY|nr:restriction endonuclease [Halobacterium bonnevillei]MXR19156.1 hypothetical protein [Halobacterium bonnevillei]